MRRSIMIGLLAAALCAGGSGAKAANLLGNGDFETPLVPAGSFTLFLNGQAIGPWTVTGATGNVGVVSGTFSQGGFSFPARSGKQWLDLTGTSNTATGVRQAVATIPGRLYELTFHVGNVKNPGGIFGTTSSVRVLVNGLLLMTAVNTSGTTKQVWRKFGAAVVASAATTTITFLNGDPSTDSECGLDDVSLEPLFAVAE